MVCRINLKKKSLSAKIYNKTELDAGARNIIYFINPGPDKIIKIQMEQDL